MYDLFGENIMFGYINIYKDELKVKDYNVFRAYYCGLCKALGRRYNQMVRLGLNYDLTFLGILLDSVYDEETDFENLGCIKNISKKKTVVRNKAVDFASDMSIILTYYKLADDIKDDKSIKALFAAVPYWFAMKKLEGKYGDAVRNIKAYLDELSVLEKEKCGEIDRCAHPFASIMKEIFSASSSSLGAIGYELGRYIYIVDACDDMDDDLKSGAYNPLNIAYDYDGKPNDELKDKIKNSIYLTLSFVACEYEKLPKFKNKEILDNIIYLGIRAKTDMAINKLGVTEKKEKNNERPI